MSRFSQFTGGSSGGGIVTGQVQEFINNSTPSGYLQLNGQCVCKATYCCLYSVLGDQDPPITDSAIIGPVSPPAGFNQTCYHGQIANGSCIVRFGIFHCNQQCGSNCKHQARLCFATSDGVCGSVSETSGGVFSSYYNSWQYAPCSPVSFNYGYDCGTCKMYAAVTYQVTFSQYGGSTRCINGVRVWNITDCTATYNCICACCYYSQTVIGTFANSCLGIMQVCNCCPYNWVAKWCFPNQCIQFHCCVNALTAYQGGNACAVQSCGFLNTGFCKIYDADGRNPCLLVGWGTNCWCFTYNCCCNLDSVNVYNVRCDLGAWTCVCCLACCYFGRLSCCNPGLSCGCPYFISSMGITPGFYCDTSNIGFTGVHTARMVICGYNIGTYWNEPGLFNISRTLLSKSCPTGSAVVFCCVTQNTFICMGTLNRCIGPAEIIYVPKCNSYHVNGATLSLIPCCVCCSAQNPVNTTYGFLASGPCTGVITCGVNCLGLCFYATDPALNVRSANIVPYCSTGTAMCVYGQSTLGAGSNVFLIPNVSHSVASLKYFIKT